MNFLPSIPYPENEKPALEKLGELFRDWHQHFADNESALEKHKANDMVFDGFYPHYFSQRMKVLMIGRESRQISGCNNMDVIYNAYRTGKYIGDQHLNANWFHKRLIYIAYGLNHGMPKWQDIPYADKIGDTFGDADGLSFAFMNISKLSNESDDPQSDWPVIRAAHTLSTQGRNFIQEEVGILEPDIIITMIPEDSLDMLGSLGDLTLIYESGMANGYWLQCGGRRMLLVNTAHFSYGSRDDIDGFYEPICNVIRLGEKECELGG